MRAHSIAFMPGYCIVAGSALLIATAIFLYAFFTPNPMNVPTSDYDFSEQADGYTAGFTNARLDTPGQPPTSTLVITDSAGTTLGEWTLGTKEFWTADPDANVIADGSWDMEKRCYTHDVWSGNYSPGTPLTEKSSREFCF